MSTATLVRPAPDDARTIFDRILVGFWLLNSVGLLVIWTLTLARGGGWEHGLFVYQSGNIPIFHLAAECLAAVTTLAGFVAKLRRASWGSAVALLGIGMFTYSAINSMGWAVHNDPAYAIPMALTLLGALLTVPRLAARAYGGS